MTCSLCTQSFLNRGRWKIPVWCFHLDSDWLVAGIAQSTQWKQFQHFNVTWLRLPSAHTREGRGQMETISAVTDSSLTPLTFLRPLDKLFLMPFLMPCDLWLYCMKIHMRYHSPPRFWVRCFSHEEQALSKGSCERCSVNLPFNQFWHNSKVLSNWVYVTLALWRKPRVPFIYEAFIFCDTIFGSLCASEVTRPLGMWCRYTRVIVQNTERKYRLLLGARSREMRCGSYRSDCDTHPGPCHCTVLPQTGPSAKVRQLG